MAAPWSEVLGGISTLAPWAGQKQGRGSCGTVGYGNKRAAGDARTYRYQPYRPTARRRPRRTAPVSPQGTTSVHAAAATGTSRCRLQAADVEPEGKRSAVYGGAAGRSPGRAWSTRRRSGRGGRGLAQVRRPAAVGGGGRWKLRAGEETHRVVKPLGWAGQDSAGVPGLMSYAFCTRAGRLLSLSFRSHRASTCWRACGSISSGSRLR